MNKWQLALLVWLAAILQGYFLSALGGSQVVPNLVVLLLFIISLKQPLKTAVGLALWAGFWLDVAGNTSFGGHMLILAGLAAGVNVLKRFGLDFNHKLSLLLGIGAANYAYNLALLVVLWLGLHRLSWNMSLLGWWSSEALITAGGAFLLARKIESLVSVRRFG